MTSRRVFSLPLFALSASALTFGFSVLGAQAPSGGDHAAHLKA